MTGVYCMNSNKTLFLLKDKLYIDHHLVVLRQFPDVYFNISHHSLVVQSAIFITTHVFCGVQCVLYTAWDLQSAKADIYLGRLPISLWTSSLTWCIIFYLKLKFELFISILEKKIIKHDCMTVFQKPFLGFVCIV